MEGAGTLERLTRITDVHIHIQPWRALKPQVQNAMRKGKEAHWDLLLSLMDDPKALLEVMDRSGVWRVGLVNYPSPDVMGFDDSTNAFDESAFSVVRLAATGAGTAEGGQGYKFRPR